MRPRLRGVTLGIPCKTAAGHAELVAQGRGLSQRHRMLLLWVDGVRPLEEVSRLGRQAGVPRGYIDELFALGLIVMGPPVTQTIHDCHDMTSVGAGASADEDEPMGNTEMGAFDVQDQSLAQARTELLKALRAHAPVAGVVTMLRVRRARTRAELRALLPDVQARLTRSLQQADSIAARQSLRRIESLLAVV